VGKQPLPGASHGEGAQGIPGQHHAAKGCPRWMPTRTAARAAGSGLGLSKAVMGPALSETVSKRVGWDRLIMTVSNHRPACHDGTDSKSQRHAAPRGGQRKTPAEAGAVGFSKGGRSSCLGEPSGRVSRRPGVQVAAASLRPL
jgi:hypothetical protein